MHVRSPDARWGVDFARADGVAGFLRLARVGGRCWAWAYLVGTDHGLVVVRDHDVVVPRSGTRTVRADGLWMEIGGEVPEDHWTFGLEAFAVSLDGALDALRDERGARIPLGFDLEWDADAGGERGGASRTGMVRGEVLVGDDRIDLEAPGVVCATHPAGVEWPTEWVGACRLGVRDWVRPAVTSTVRAVAGLRVPARARLDRPGVDCVDEPLDEAVEVAAVVPVPLSASTAGASVPVLVRVLARLRDASGATGVGWLEVLQLWSRDEGSDDD